MGLWNHRYSSIHLFLHLTKEASLFPLTLRGEKRCRGGQSYVRVHSESDERHRWSGMVVGALGPLDLYHHSGLGRSQRQEAHRWCSHLVCPRYGRRRLAVRGYRGPWGQIPHVPRQLQHPIGSRRAHRCVGHRRDFPRNRRCRLRVGVDLRPLGRGTGDRRALVRWFDRCSWSGRRAGSRRQWPLGDGLPDHHLIMILQIHGTEPLPFYGSGSLSYTLFPMPSVTLPFSRLQDSAVQDVLKKYSIGLTVAEARKVTEMLGRDPTLTEAVIWGIQGSEHCSYKSSRRFLKQFPMTGRHVILGPSEDSGIVALTDEPPGKRWGIVVSHESHNHPSQVVPYEGAATGIGGVVRDVFCMGARVIGCLDALRFGDLQSDESRTIAREVVRGIGGYGNPLGIPNLGGDTVFDSSYNTNCLVNAIALGIVREDHVIHSFVPEEAGTVGYDIILVGKATDRSGFGGAAFASAMMSDEDEERNTGAVQEPNPFLERHLLASTYALFDWLVENNHLDKVSFKDLGAGGVVCVTVEQVADQGCGAVIDLDRVHVSLAELPPEVIACAETQERMCWMCHPSLTNHIVRHYNEIWDVPAIAEGARASVVGKVTNDGRYRLLHGGDIVCDAQAKDITQGLYYERPVRAVRYTGKEPTVHRDSFSLSDIFHALLRHKNHASKEWVYNTYDKSVQGNTVLEAGEADAGVIVPLQDLSAKQAGEECFRGVAVSVDGNNRYGRISPYWQGFNAATEAMCNVAAVGGLPRALTDCLNYGNPEIPEQLWALAEGVRGITDAARAIPLGKEPIPVISGNVSLYNGLPAGSAIDPSAIVSCIGVLLDGRKAVTMQVKNSGSALLLVGNRKDECGGSAYYEVLEELANVARDTFLGANVPQPDTMMLLRAFRFLRYAVEQELLLASHDISDGGMLLALFEMTRPQRGRGGSVGMDIDLDLLKSDLRSDTLLFTQTPGFILEVAQENMDSVRTLAAAKGVVLQRIGRTTKEPSLRIRHGSEMLIDEQLQKLFSPLHPLL
ncbi:phosphoribosylformylglycinamidine synthase subunit PurL [Candidatus Peregrinibacteria bacterium CG10_big_fil_rev_8_21_14_0_10_49_16]|nr:MAG: phosphoribosylformylglycinamidine synthase subunit PurL [Candidatus Peregrinibacteria bacterium CG10_big_fil_rev_8_21_14_0_10_49_16]